MSEEKLLEREVKVSVQDPEGSGGGQVRRRLYGRRGWEVTNPGGSTRKLRGQAALPAACPRDNDPRQQSHFPSLHV